MVTSQSIDLQWPCELNARVGLGGVRGGEERRGEENKIKCCIWRSQEELLFHKNKEALPAFQFRPVTQYVNIPTALRDDNDRPVHSQVFLPLTNLGQAPWRPHIAGKSRPFWLQKCESLYKNIAMFFFFALISKTLLLLDVSVRKRTVSKVQIGS